MWKHHISLARATVLHSPFNDGKDFLGRFRIRSEIPIGLALDSRSSRHGLERERKAGKRTCFVWILCVTWPQYCNVAWLPDKLQYDMRCLISNLLCPASWQVINLSLTSPLTINNILNKSSKIKHVVAYLSLNIESLGDNWFFKNAFHHRKGMTRTPLRHARYQFDVEQALKEYPITHQGPCEKCLH